MATEHAQWYSAVSYIIDHVIFQKGNCNKKIINGRKYRLRHCKLSSFCQYVTSMCNRLNIKHVILFYAAIWSSALNQFQLAWFCFCQPDTCIYFVQSFIPFVLGHCIVKRFTIWQVKTLLTHLRLISSFHITVDLIRLKFMFWANWVTFGFADSSRTRHTTSQRSA